MDLPYLASFLFFISKTFHDETTEILLCMPLSVAQRLYWRPFINCAIAILFAANIKEALKFGILLLDTPGTFWDTNKEFFLQNVTHLYNLTPHNEYQGILFTKVAFNRITFWLLVPEVQVWNLYQFFTKQSVVFVRSLLSMFSAEFQIDCS